MASSGAQSIAIDECMALDVVGEVAQAHHIGFIGNLHVTTVLFEETEEGRRTYSAAWTRESASPATCSV